MARVARPALSLATRLVAGVLSLAVALELAREWRPYLAELPAPMQGRRRGGSESNATPAGERPAITGAFRVVGYGGAAFGVATILAGGLVLFGPAAARAAAGRAVPFVVWAWTTRRRMASNSPPLALTGRLRALPVPT